MSTTPWPPPSLLSNLARTLSLTDISIYLLNLGIDSSLRASYISKYLIRCTNRHWCVSFTPSALRVLATVCCLGRKVGSVVDMQPEVACDQIHLPNHAPAMKRHITRGMAVIFCEPIRLNANLDTRPMYRANTEQLGTPHLFVTSI